MQPETVLFPSLYEEDYILRSLGNNLLNQPDIALTELVANAWDAGASQVTISIPEHYGDVLSVEDNGEGVKFNIFAYNAQPGVVIDYATGDSTLE